MGTFRFQTGDSTAIVDIGNKSYIAGHRRQEPESPFYDEQKQVVVADDSALYEFTDDEQVEYDDNDYITDENGVVFKSIVGPRPKNIVRR